MAGVLNTPMVLYPLHTLKQLGAEDVLIISGGGHIGDFAEFLMDGRDYGLNLTYRVQRDAGGIAEALALAEDFVNGETFAVILGDNYFDDISTTPIKKDTPTIFLKAVSDAHRFGVFDPKERVIIEKPLVEISDLAVTGLYIYDKEVFSYIKGISPSSRGELEISDVNNLYLEEGDRMEVVVLNTYWTDMGTPESLGRTIFHIANKPGYETFEV
jgi:glucose-1-phosphate thymidylyltransferase